MMTKKSGNPWFLPSSSMAEWNTDFMPCICWVIPRKDMLEAKPPWEWKSWAEVRIWDGMVLPSQMVGAKIEYKQVMKVAKWVRDYHGIP